MKEGSKSGGPREEVVREIHSTGGVTEAGKVGHTTVGEVLTTLELDKQVTTETADADLILRALCVLQSGLKLGILSVEKVMADSNSNVRTSRQESSRRRL